MRVGQILRSDLREEAEYGQVEYQSLDAGCDRLHALILIYNERYKISGYRRPASGALSRGRYQLLLVAETATHTLSS